MFWNWFCVFPLEGMVFFERAFFGLQRAESEGFLGCGFVEVISEFFVCGAHEGEE